MQELWVALSGAMAQEKKVDTLANNLANANTPGFKKDRLVFREYLTHFNKPPEMMDLPRGEWRPEDYYRTEGTENSYVRVDGTYTNFSQGMLKPTGNPLDLGIQGKGFFEVQTPQGLRLTRRGNLTIDGKGELVLGSFPVLKKGGPGAPASTRKINLSGVKKLVIDRLGTLFADGNSRGQISLVIPTDAQSLRKDASGLFSFAQGELKDQVPKSQIHQGHLEMSNVRPMVEMSELIKAHRNFESIQRVMKAYDSIAGKAVNEISRF